MTFLFNEGLLNFALPLPHLSVIGTSRVGDKQWFFHDGISQDCGLCAKWPVCNVGCVQCRFCAKWSVRNVGSVQCGLCVM